MGRNARGGGRSSFRMGAPQLLGLELELDETRTFRQGPGGHDALLSQAPVVRVRA
jgi:hypothetical protein